MANDSQGWRSNDGKMRPTLISPVVLWLLGKVLQFGARKYAAHNWVKGLSWEETADSFQRHYLRWMMGEEMDEESQLPHLAHMMCNVMFLLHMQATGSGRDDREFVKHPVVPSYMQFFTQAHPQKEEEKKP